MKINSLVFCALFIFTISNLFKGLHSKRIKTKNFPEFTETNLKIIHLNNSILFETVAFYRNENLIQNPFGIDLIILTKDFKILIPNNDKLCDILEPYNPSSEVREANFFVPFNRMDEDGFNWSQNQLTIRLKTQIEGKVIIKLDMDRNIYSHLITLQLLMKNILNNFSLQLKDNQQFCEDMTTHSCDGFEDISEGICLNNNLMYAIKLFISKASDNGLASESFKPDCLNISYLKLFVNTLCAKHGADLNMGIDTEVNEMVKELESENKSEIILDDFFKARLIK